MKKTKFISSILIFIITISSVIIVQAQNAWINEIHYDNAGTDVDEIIEVIIENPGTYNLADFQVHLYNGNGGVMYDSRAISTFTVGAGSGNFTFYFLNYTAAGSGIQNGEPDGMALSYQGTLITGQFLSYEGTFVATDGPAAGITSADIGVGEDNTTPRSITAIVRHRYTLQRFCLGAACDSYPRCTE